MKILAIKNIITETAQFSSVDLTQEERDKKTEAWILNTEVKSVGNETNEGKKKH